MPKFTVKEIQTQIEAQKIWPVYWIVGPETMLANDVLKRLKKAVFGKGNDDESFNVEKFDGAQARGAEIVDAALSLSFMGGPKLIIISNADQIKEAEAIEEILGDAQVASNVETLVIALASDLDARKKFSKRLVKSAAVVMASAVKEYERAAWIDSLCKKRKLNLSHSIKASLESFEPWSLDVIDGELEKLSVLADPSQYEEVLSVGVIGVKGSDFVEAVMSRNYKRALSLVRDFCNKPDESLPLVGLLAWNFKQLTLLIGAEQGKSDPPRLSPFVMKRLSSWSKVWDFNGLELSQRSLFELDFSTKQTPKSALGNWSTFIRSIKGAGA